MIVFSVASSSRERYWSGFDATVYEATAGFDETLCTSHSISMHLSAPVSATSKCDGVITHRVQSAGDVKIIPAGFSRTWEIERPARKITINVNPAFLATTAEAMNVPAGTVALAPHLHVCDRAIERIAYALRDELESDAPIGRLYAESLGSALAAHLVRRYAVRCAPRVPAGQLSKPRLARVFAYIREHIASDLGLCELANIVSVSPSHFNALFKRSTGIPVHQYVMRARVEHAARLIAGDELALSEIALRSGFSSQSHMATCLRRLAGVTPGELRRGGPVTF